MSNTLANRAIFRSDLEGLDGDYSNNGRVEQQDLDLVLLHWGAAFDALPTEWINQRPTMGIVDQAELDGVLLSWGNVAGRGAAAVPEPTAAYLLILAGLLAVRVVQQEAST